MKAILIFLAVVFGFFALTAVAVGFYWMSVNNQEVTLRNTINAKGDMNVASLDTMWKILKDKAGVADQYKGAFKEIYPELIKAQNADKNLLAKFTSVALPNLSPALYKDLSNAVEAERKRFYNDQKELRNLKNQHDILISKVPSKWFVSNTTPTTVTIVTSDDADTKFKTGKDNDTLFNGEKK